MVNSLISKLILNGINCILRKYCRFSDIWEINICGYSSHFDTRLHMWQVRHRNSLKSDQTTPAISSVFHDYVPYLFCFLIVWVHGKCLFIIPRAASGTLTAEVSHKLHSLQCCEMSSVECQVLLLRHITLRFFMRTQAKMKCQFSFNSHLVLT